MDTPAVLERLWSTVIQPVSREFPALLVLPIAETHFSGPLVGVAIRCRPSAVSLSRRVIFEDGAMDVDAVREVAAELDVHRRRIELG